MYDDECMRKYGFLSKKTFVDHFSRAMEGNGPTQTSNVGDPKDVTAAVRFIRETRSLIAVRRHCLRLDSSASRCRRISLQDHFGETVRAIPSSEVRHDANSSESTGRATVKTVSAAMEALGVSLSGELQFQPVLASCARRIKAAMTTALRLTGFLASEMQFDRDEIPRYGSYDSCPCSDG